MASPGRRQRSIQQHLLTARWLPAAVASAHDPACYPASGASTAIRPTQTAGSGERHRPPAVRFVPAVGFALRTQPATLQGIRPSPVIVTPVFEVGVPASTEHGIAVRQRQQRCLAGQEALAFKVRGRATGRLTTGDGHRTIRMALGPARHFGERGARSASPARPPPGSNTKNTGKNEEPEQHRDIPLLRWDGLISHLPARKSEARGQKRQSSCRRETAEGGLRAFSIPE